MCRRRVFNSALPLRHTGDFFDYHAGDRIRALPKSHFIDRCISLNHCTTASFQRISLKCMVVCAYTNRGTQGSPHPSYQGDEHPLRSAATPLRRGGTSGYKKISGTAFVERWDVPPITQCCNPTARRATNVRNKN